MLCNSKMSLLIATIITLGCGLLAPASADCCGPPPPAPDDFQLGPGWSATVLYEHMDMKTLLDGSKEVSADQVLTKRLNAGATRFSVPTRMFMDRASVQLRYKFDNNHALRVSIPWRSNQMDMRMARKGGGGMNHGGGHTMHRQMLKSEHMTHTDDTSDMSDHANHDMGNMGDQANHGMANMNDHANHGMDHASGMPGPTFMNHTMEPLEGLGDVIVNYTYSFPLDDGQAWVGVGAQIPTGEWDARSSSGQLVHNMMQMGSGSIGLLGEAAADIPVTEGGKLSIHPRVGVQWNGTNPLGYQRGVRFDYEIGTRYDIVDEVGLSLDLVGFTMGKDSTNGTIDPITGQVAFQAPQTSLVDNVENTGGHFLFIAPGIRAKPTEDIFLGFQYRVPISQKVNGTQLGIDSWYRAFLSARF